MRLYGCRQLQLEVCPGSAQHDRSWDVVMEPSRNDVIQILYQLRAHSTTKVLVVCLEIEFHVPNLIPSSRVAARVQLEHFRDTAEKLGTVGKHDVEVALKIN